MQIEAEEEESFMAMAEAVDKRPKMAVETDKANDSEGGIHPTRIVRPESKPPEKLPLRQSHHRTMIESLNNITI